MNPLIRRLLLAVAVALHLAAGVFYLAAGLVAPLWAVLALWVAWAVLLAALVRLWRRRPPLALLVPLAAVALIFGTITTGEQLLGWTA
jgi:hypothetical protein